jgi:hypothetical protein
MIQILKQGKRFIIPVAQRGSAPQHHQESGERGTKMSDDLKVKAHKAVDDARVEAHSAYDDASDNAKIQVSKAVADAKIATHEVKSELKKR